MAVNKVVYGNTTLIDLTGTTATANKILQGYGAYGKDGVWMNGTASSGGGGGMNAQKNTDIYNTNQTSYTATGLTLTIAVTGTYDISWSGWRNATSNTFGSRLYINDVAYGTAVTTFTGTYGQTVHLEGVELSADDVIEVRARARNTSYKMYVTNLCAIQTA